jgi:hypothetical protein
MLLVGSVVMGVSMVIVGIIVAKFRHDWPSHVAAGWTAVGTYYKIGERIFAKTGQTDAL